MLILIARNPILYGTRLRVKFMHAVYVAFGSNLGHRLGHLQRAFKALSDHILTEIEPSVVLETPALLLPNSPQSWDKPYLNMVVRAKTSLKPEALLSALKSVEEACGRDLNQPRWSPRAIDLDLLLYDDICRQSERLTIPHSELKNRGFLLHLLAMLNPELKYPGTDETFDALACAALKTEAPWTRTMVLYPRCMGIVNITPDSFSDGGKYFNPDAAVAHCRQLLSDGASILDIGAQSTRPHSVQLTTAKDEWKRLQPVLDRLDLQTVPVSIDTYREEVIEKLLSRYKIAWINDVSGRLPERTLRLIAEKGCKICTMHSLSVPPKKDEVIDPPLEQTMFLWFQKQVEHLTNCGFALKNIILDPGIGFGNTPYQAGLLFKTIEQMKHWGCEVLLGHSRKSCYDALSVRKPQDRDLETISISLLLKNKVDYLRVHDVAKHQRAFAAQQWVESCRENGANIL